MKVFELKIDEEDDLSGIQYISIVKNPATEISWEVFNDQTPQTCSHKDDLTKEQLALLDNYGTLVNSEAFLNAEVKDIEELVIENFAVPSINPNPRQPSFGDDNSDAATSISRYIYVVDTGVGAPLMPTSRQLCRKMLLAQKVWSRTDIQNYSLQLTAQGDTFKLVPRARVNGSVDFFEYKSGNRCRHKWAQIDFPIGLNETYEEALNKIPLKAQAALGRGEEIAQSSRPFISEARYLNRLPTRMSKVEMTKPIGFHFGLFVYSSRFAAMLAEPTAKTISKVKLGVLEGYCPVDITDEYFEGTGEIMERFKVRESFTKVPEYMREAAERAVKYAEENGWGSCGTDVGKRRANDLADATYDASLDILTRMYSYGSRHKKDWEASKSFDDGCGALMMASWGFTPENYDEAMSFLEREIKKATEMNVQFSSNEMKGDITAVVFQPNQKIYRWDRETNQPYYVFMSRDTIRKMLMKLSRLKPKNLINFEHSGMVFSGDDVYTYENWLVGDDPKKDKSYELFGREFEPGTWLTTIHFGDKRIFEEFVLTQKTTSISLEGLFEEVPFNFFDVKKEDFVNPQPGETADVFIGRCMGELQGEFPEEKQRLAVCYSYLKERFDFPDGTCWTGYQPYGTKIVDGREVPNCVPVKASIDTNGMVDYMKPNEKTLEKKDIFPKGVEFITENIPYDDIEDDICGTCWDSDGYYGNASAYGFAPYEWDDCIRDMTERYGENAAPRICGKIRSENMTLIGLVNGAPFFTDKETAEVVSGRIGCEGSHEHELNGVKGFMPCRTHKEALDLYNAENLVYMLEQMLKEIDNPKKK